MVIIDFHAHVGDILPVYRNIPFHESAPPPHYLMISSHEIEDAERLFFRKRPRWWTPAFVKHALITLFRRKQTWRGMVIPNLLSDMRSHGITKSIVLPIEYADGIDRSSRLIQECQTSEQLLPFCSVHPNDPKHLVKLRRYMQMGAKGLKLHPNFQQTFPDDPVLFPLYKAYSDYQRPLMLHSGLTGRERHRFSALQRIRSLPERFPEMPIVLAHAGISEYPEAIKLAQQHNNVYLELSGQPAQHIRQALSELGSTRLLFGTDWPFWNQRLALQAVKDAVENDVEASRNIFYENAKILLHLNEEEETW